MSSLHVALAESVEAWRESRYACEAFPAIAELLDFAIEDDEHRRLRFLRAAQFQALETYWYLRLVAGTPRIRDLYERLFPKPGPRRDGLGIPNELFEEADYDFDALGQQQSERIEKTIELRKPNLPPLRVVRRIVRYRRQAPSTDNQPLGFEAPTTKPPTAGRIVHWTIVEPDTGRPKLAPVADAEVLQVTAERSAYSAAAELAANYHVPATEVLVALRDAYGAGNPIPEHHLPELGEQIEAQRAAYERYEEEIEVAVALVRPEGFEREIREGAPVYTARVSFAKDRAALYRTADTFSDTDRARDVSFHYEGYNFDSTPEATYLERVLALIDSHPDALEGVWFTGGLTDPGKTELFAEYLGEDGRWHRYTPDFVLRRRSDGKHLVVEIKSDQHRAVVTEDLGRHARGEAPVSPEGRKAVALRCWEALDPSRLAYEVIFAGSTLPMEALDRTRAFVEGR